MPISRNRYMRIRSTSGASLTDYAIIVALVSGSAIGAVIATGGGIAELYNRVGNEVAQMDVSEPGEGTLPTPGRPTASLIRSIALIRTGTTVTFAWETEGAHTVSASYVLSQSCLQLEAAGPGPHALPWTLLDGTAEISWDLDRAGCSMSVELAATSDAGTTTATSSVAFETADTTPESLVFEAISGVDPGSVTSSSPATVSDITADITIGSDAADVLVSLANDPTRASSITVAPGAQIQLHATAPAGFAETRSVPFTAGGLSGTWLVTTRARDTEALISSLGPNALGLDVSTTRRSSVATLSDFDGPLDLTITRSTTAATNGTVRYSKNGGGYVTLGATNPVTVPVNRDDRIQIEYVAPSTYKSTAFDIATTIAIGSPDTARTWTAGIRAGRSCPATPVTFVGITGAVCYGNLPLTHHGIRESADDLSGDIQGGATFTCNDGTWTQFLLSDCHSGHEP